MAKFSSRGPLEGMADVRRYFAWAGFRAPDLVLHVIETDDQLCAVVRAFLVDLADLSLPVTRPERPHRYERLVVRSELFRQVLGDGRSWQELGSDCPSRCFRDPDVYNFDFWNHFKHKLPTASLPWSEAANDVDDPTPLLPARRSG